MSTYCRTLQFTSLFGKVSFGMAFFSASEQTKVEITGNTVSQQQTNTMPVLLLSIQVGCPILREEGLKTDSILFWWDILFDKRKTSYLIYFKWPLTSLLSRVWEGRHFSRSDFIFIVEKFLLLFNWKTLKITYLFACRIVTLVASQFCGKIVRFPLVLTWRLWIETSQTF